MVEMIMRAAARVLIRDGYEAFTTNRVAEAAGASVGSLYQYFSSKQQLVAALLDRHVELTMQQLRQAVPQMMLAPPTQAVPHFVRLAIEAHRIEPELHRVFFEQLPRIADYAKLETTSREGLALVEAYLRTHAHEIGPQDHARSAFMLVHTVEALTHAAVLARPELLATDAYVEEVSALVLGYLRPAARARPRPPARKRQGKGPRARA